MSMVLHKLMQQTCLRRGVKNLQNPVVYERPLVFKNTIDIFQIFLDRLQILKLKLFHKCNTIIEVIFRTTGIEATTQRSPLNLVPLAF